MVLSSYLLVSKSIEVDKRLSYDSYVLCTVVGTIVLLDSESAYQCERNSNYQYVIYMT